MKPRVIVIVIVIVIVLLLLFFLKLYPAMVVGNMVVTIRDLEHYREIALKLNSKSSEQDATKQLIDNLKSQAVAKKLKVFPNAVQESQEKVFLTKGKQSDLQKVISKSFSSSEEFDRFVIRPAAIKTQLMIKYNQDKKINQTEWDRANDLLLDLKKGVKFEAMAKQRSDDQVTGQFGGDMGFFELGEILPELEMSITNSQVGKIHDGIIVSRLGYHLIYLVETAEVDGVKQWHAKHILIQTTGFETWFENYADEVKVWQIVR